MIWSPRLQPGLGPTATVTIDIPAPGKVRKHTSLSLRPRTTEHLGVPLPPALPPLNTQTALSSKGPGVGDEDRLSPGLTLAHINWLSKVLGCGSTLHSCEAKDPTGTPLGRNDSGDLRVLGTNPDQGGRRPGVVAEGNRPEQSLLFSLIRVLFTPSGWSHSHFTHPHALALPWRERSFNLVTKVAFVSCGLYPITEPVRPRTVWVEHAALGGVWGQATHFIPWVTSPAICPLWALVSLKR